MSVSTMLVCSALAGVALSDEATPKELRSELIRRVFNEFNKETMHLLDEFYAEGWNLKIPSIGLKVWTHCAYYAKMYENVRSIAFDITNEVVEGDTHVVVWTMEMTVAKFNKGKPAVTHGNSVIRFNEENKAVYHRDYFDMGEMLYKHVPVLGYLVKKANAKLEKGQRD